MGSLISNWILRSGVRDIRKRSVESEDFRKPIMAAIDIENVECVSSIDGLEDEEIHSSVSHNNQSAHPHHYSSKPLGVGGIAPTSVHELLECPVCTNSMYPPIHQVCSIFLFVFRLLNSFSFLLHCRKRLCTVGWWECVKLRGT